MKTRTIIWIVAIVIFAIILCVLIPSSNKKSTQTEIFNSKNIKSDIKKTKHQNVDFDGSEDVKFGQNLGHKNLETIEYAQSIYDQLDGRSIDESISILEKQGCLAKKIIPDFPYFPRIWILPPTAKDKYASLGERYCVEFLELLFPNYKFNKIRPTWLRNPKTNRCLELDGFCSELMIAVEYNGIQHYVWPNFTNCSREQFLQQRYRDQIKEDICRDKNICLLRIPYTVPMDRIPLAIYSQLLDGVPGLNPSYFQNN